MVSLPPISLREDVKVSPAVAGATLDETTADSTTDHGIGCQATDKVITCVLWQQCQLDQLSQERQAMQGMIRIQ
jgi:hypothetical protein